MQFTDRAHAGRLLAAKLKAYRSRHDAIVFALPRGGVVVGYEVAIALHVPLDVLVARKVGLPDCHEMAIGALASGGIKTISNEAVARFQVSPEELRNVIAEARKELCRQEQLYRGNRPFPEIKDKLVIIVDDGLATGNTMKAAIAAVRANAPKEIVVAVPVGATDTCELLARDVDRVVCLSTPPDFYAVGAFYECFRQVTDDTVKMLLEKANENLLGLAPSVETQAETRRLTKPGNDLLFVKTAHIKLSRPQTVEIGLSNGRIVRLTGEAAREPINALALAQQCRDYHSTFGLPVEGGNVLVVDVNGKNLSKTHFQ